MKKTIRQAACTLAAFLFLLLLLCFVDRGHIGAMGTEVGLSSINGFFFKTFGRSDLFDKLSDVVFLLTFLYPAFFGVMGIVELIQKKDLKKVHKSLLAFIPVFVLLVVLYLLFTKVSPNYRPVLTEEGLEESFPSSHVMVSIMFSLTGLTMFRDFHFKLNSAISKTVETAAFVLPCLVAVFRLLSGMHWFTDVLGGIFLGAFLVQLHRLCTEYKRT
ncbi:MAG: phosphatase PAP2 family protein [Spirochaetales bacterium]|nr:phosphatase PAP2 family protein [Candidatus Physcosoma equi]